MGANYQAARVLISSDSDTVMIVRNAWTAMMDLR